MLSFALTLILGLGSLLLFAIANGNHLVIWMTGVALLASATGTLIGAWPTKKSGAEETTAHPATEVNNAKLAKVEDLETLA